MKNAVQDALIIILLSYRDSIISSREKSQAVDLLLRHKVILTLPFTY